MPTSSVRRRARWGSMLRPVRGSASILTNTPDGWVSDQGGPVAWSLPVTGDDPPFWWVGESVESGRGPIGPHGPWTTAPGSGLPVVTRATSLLVDPLVSGEFRVRDRRMSPVGDLVRPPRWLTDPQLVRAAPGTQGSVLPAALRRVRSVFWRELVASALWLGSGFLWFQEDAAGAPLAGTLRVLNPALVEITDDGRWRVDDVVFDFDGRWSGGRLVQLRNPHGPLGVFAQHPATFQLARSVQGYTAGTFRSGVPAGYLKVTSPQLTQGQADGLKQAWMTAHGGDGRSIAVLNATTDFTPIQLSPVDANLVEVERQVIAAAAMAFGMAPETLGVSLGGSMTYSNIRDWFDAHRDLALSPWIASTQGTLSALLPDGVDVEINLDAYTQPGLSERITSGAAATGAGLVTVDEWRGAEGLPPLTDVEVPS